MIAAFAGKLEAGWSARAARTTLLLGILLDLALIGGRAATYTPFLAQRDSLTYLVQPVAALLVYAGVAIAVTSRPRAGRAAALSTGSLVGILTGVLWVVNLTLETFASFSGLASILSTAPFLLGGFALWGVAGGVSSRRTGSPGLGVLAAVWAALICVVITITYGLLLAYTSLPRLEHNLAFSPDYVRSGWRDLRAFAIANQFEAAGSHLIEAPLIAAAVGVAGSALSVAWVRLRRRGAEPGAASPRGRRG